MFVRRSFAVIAAASALCAVTAPAASPAAAAGAGAGARASTASAGKLPDGLYGKADPKYDGVWRQSVALLAQDAAGAKPAAKAVEWLAEQQCDDGSFTAYRADPGAGCDAKKTPADTNATALAVQALSAVGGRSATVRESLAWLGSVQNKDGGWGYNPGSPTDANSVSVVMGAYSAAGREPERIRKGGASPYDALETLQLGCDAEASGRGAYAYQPGKKGELAANDDATAAATLAGFGSGLLVGDGGRNGAADGESRKSRPVEPLKCGDGDGKQPGGRTEAAEAGAAYLASVLKKGGGHLRAVTPGAEGGPDYANTADAVIALAAGGHRAEAEKSLDWLAGELGKWDKSRNDPAAIGGVMLAVHATGGDAAKLGGVGLLKRLNATGPQPARVPEENGGGDEDGQEGSSSVATWSLVGAGLAAGAGVGFLLSGRRKRQGL
ncbi:prenyltransferase/squalene oxidase repeat-containing protein [Streptomyces ovatisporus]|uniref:Prenyltransferase/squalene oxidase repeat-containing protein n=2 Tax=Streptomyces ovatisporus TaxID=1128682 RepID=A0ABV9A342_9ACTN